MKRLKFIILFIICLFYSCQTLEISQSSNRFNQIVNEFHDYNSEKILIAAHRAQHTKYPENSLASIKHSIDSGIDIIEIDVRESKDGKLILMHDSTIDRTTNGEGEVSLFTFSELKEFQLTNWISDTLTHRIPTLKDALELSKNQIIVDIDIKGASVKSLVSIVKETGTEAQAEKRQRPRDHLGRTSIPLCSGSRDNRGTS